MFNRFIKLAITLGNRNVTTLDRKAAQQFDLAEKLRKQAEQAQLAGVRLLEQAVALEIRVEALQEV